MEEIKILLNTILEIKKDLPKLTKLFDDYHKESEILTPRQFEIDNFNNTIQRISTLNGLYALKSKIWIKKLINLINLFLFFIYGLLLYYIYYIIIIFSLYIYIINIFIYIINKGNRIKMKSI